MSNLKCLPPWVLDFKKEFGFFPIAGGDGSAPAGAPPAGAPPAGAPPAPDPTAPVDLRAGFTPGGTPPAPAINPQDIKFNEIIPAEYKDKPWIKDVKDLPGLFKRTDGLLTEMGKRPAGIPEDNAPEEKWTAFNKAFGVPEKPEDYKLSPGTTEQPADPKFQEGIKSVFHKAGVSARQAKVLEAGYNDLVTAFLKDAKGASEAQDADFEKITNSVFGERKAEALNGAKQLIMAHTPEALKPHIEKLSNENLIILSGVLDAVRQQYISEDAMPRGGSAPMGMSQEQRQAKGRELMASKAYQNPFDPEHEKVKAEVQRLYGTI